MNAEIPFTNLSGLSKVGPEIVIMAARAVAVYIAAILIVRLGKTRTLGRATPLDIILALIPGSMFSRSINGDAPLVPTFAAGMILMFLRWAFSGLARKWPLWTFLINGPAVPLVLDGQIQAKNMAATEISEEDLYEALRLRGGGVEIGQVAEAHLERNGKISILTHH